MAAFLRQDATFANLTTSDLPSLTISGFASFTQTGTFSGNIKAPLNQDYRVWERVTYNATIQRFSAKCSTGSLVATAKINSTAIGNCVFPVSTSQVTSTTVTPNTTTTGDVIVITVSSVTSAADFSFTIDYSWTLQ